MKTILIIIIISLLGYATYTKFTPKPIPPTIDKSEQDIQEVMARPEFQKSMRIQAENTVLDEQKQLIEKRKEELRKEELNLATSTKHSVLK